MTKYSYRVYDRDENMVKEAFRELSAEGVNRFVLKDVLPELKTRVLICNYPISDVFIDLDGKRYTYRNMEFFRKEVKMGDIFPEEILTKEAKISCQLLNGELLEVAQ